MSMPCMMLSIGVEINLEAKTRAEVDQAVTYETVNAVGKITQPW